MTDNAPILFYDVGHNWVWLHIFKDGYVAVFRSHLEEDETYEILGMFDNDHKFVSHNSSLGYGGKRLDKDLEYYSSEPVANTSEDLANMQKIYHDLEVILDKRNGYKNMLNFNSFRYYGVDFKKLTSDLIQP